MLQGGGQCYRGGAALQGGAVLQGGGGSSLSVIGCNILRIWIMDVNHGALVGRDFLFQNPRSLEALLSTLDDFCTLFEV